MNPRVFAIQHSQVLLSFFFWVVVGKPSSVVHAKACLLTVFFGCFFDQAKNASNKNIALALSGGILCQATMFKIGLFGQAVALSNGHVSYDALTILPVISR